MAYLRSTGLNKIIHPPGTVVKFAMGTPNTTTYDGNAHNEITCTNFTASIVKTLGDKSKIYGMANYSHTQYQGNSALPADMNIWFDRTSPSTATDIGDGRHYIRNEGGTLTYQNFYGMGALSFVDATTTNGTYTYVCHFTGGHATDTNASAGIVGAGDSTLVLMEVII